jgi:hypothetical protein
LSGTNDNFVQFPESGFTEVPVLETKDKCCQAETSTGFQQYGGGIKKWEQAERRSDLKEEASDLERQVVATKTRESARERECGTKWNFH